MKKNIDLSDIHQAPMIYELAKRSSDRHFGGPLDDRSEQVILVAGLNEGGYFLLRNPIVDSFFKSAGQSLYFPCKFCDEEGGICVDFIDFQAMNGQLMPISASPLFYHLPSDVQETILNIASNFYTANKARVDTMLGVEHALEMLI